MDEKHLQAMELITEILVTAGVAAPIVVPFVAGISYLIANFAKSGPTLSQLADRMEPKLDANDAFGQAELARLRGMVD